MAAEIRVHDRMFRDDLMVLATDGVPLWDGVTEDRYPAGIPQRGGKMACIARQGSPPRQYRGNRRGMDFVSGRTY
jgi:hypothetical protein